MSQSRYFFTFQRPEARRAVDLIRPLWKAEGKPFTAGLLELLLREIKARRAEIDALKKED